MTITSLIGLVIVMSFLVLMLIFSVLRNSSTEVNLRPITAYTKLKQAIGLAVEDGSQIHVSLGRGGVTSPQSASAFVGLSMLKQVIKIASAGDRPPMATTGNAALSILAQDTIQGTQGDIKVKKKGTATSGELTGLTPFSYAAGTIPFIRNDRVAANILAGWYGNEIIWLTAAGDRQNSFTLAGTAHLPAQAVMYSSVEEPLIGEELYAGGAYLDAGSMHVASLNVQDIFRWIIVTTILVGMALKLAGFGQVMQNLLAGTP